MRYYPYPVIAFTGYKLVMSVMSKSILFSIVWAVPLVFALNFRSNLEDNGKNVIYEMYL